MLEVSDSIASRAGEIDRSAEAHLPVRFSRHHCRIADFVAHTGRTVRRHERIPLANPTRPRVHDSALRS